MRRASSPAVLLAVLAGLPLLGACRDSSVHDGEARVEPHGVVQVAKPGEPYVRITKAKTLKDGDRVRVRSGTAMVKLPKGELDLRESSTVKVAAVPELLAGDLLVLPSKALSVASAGTSARLTGPTRLQYTSSLTIASYEGAADITSAGSKLHVPALRQAAVPALGQLPRTPSPLQYRADDAWDRRFLADAIDLGAELQARSTGATAQYPDQGHTLGFYRTLYPALESEPAFTAGLLDAGRPAGEHIVGAGIVLAGKEGDFASRWSQVFTFRSEGAAWGLVAMDQRVSRVPGLLRLIDEALGRSPVTGLNGQLALATTPTTTRTGSTPKSTTTTTRRTTTTTAKPPTTTPTTQEPIVTIPNPPDTGLPIPDQAADHAADVLNGLLPKK